MKKKLLVIMTLLLTISLVACGNLPGQNTANPSGNGNAEETKKVEPLDLSGQWVQEGKDASESHMVATIREDGKIGVFFILEDDPEPWTYWVGTYDAPTEDTDKYSWTSQSTYSGNGLLASTDSAKDFEYKSGKLTYVVSIDGETSEVSLVRGSWDESGIPVDAFTSVKASASDAKDVEIKETAWYVKGGYLYYYIVLHNPNEDIAVEYPTFRITARDADGVVLNTEDQTLSIIYPGQDFYYGSMAFDVSETPTTVDIEMLAAEDYNLLNASALDAFSTLEPVNTAVRGNQFVGEISNPNATDFDMAIVVAVGKDADGNVTMVDSTFVDNLQANGTVPFSIDHYGDEAYEDVEFYANQWT